MSWQLVCGMITFTGRTVCGVLTEIWLNNETPESHVNMDGFSWRRIDTVEKSKDWQQTGQRRLPKCERQWRHPYYPYYVTVKDKVCDPKHQPSWDELSKVLCCVPRSEFKVGAPYFSTLSCGLCHWLGVHYCTTFTCFCSFTVFSYRLTTDSSIALCWLTNGLWMWRHSELWILAAEVNGMHASFTHMWAF